MSSSLQFTLLSATRRQIAEDIQAIDEEIADAHARKGKKEAQLEMLDTLIQKCDHGNADGKGEQFPKSAATARTVPVTKVAGSMNATVLNRESHEHLGNIKQTIADLLPRSFGQNKFTKKDLIERIQMEFPNAKFVARSFEGPLQKLVEEEVIHIVQRGSGQSPTIYSARNPLDDF